MKTIHGQSFIIRPFRNLVKYISSFLLGTVLTVVYAHLVHAQTSSSHPIAQNPYSIETIFAAVIGAIITIFFLRGMYLVLTFASKTYGLDEKDTNNSTENSLLFLGASGWVFGSAFIIAFYGWGWQFLYIGPILCLLGPLVPILAMQADLKQYREILASRYR